MNTCCGEGILWFLHENPSLCSSKSQAAAWILCLTPFHMDSSITLSVSVAAFSVFTSLFCPSPQPTINFTISLGEESLPSPALTPDCPWVAFTPMRCVWFGCLQVLEDLDYKTLHAVPSDPELFCAGCLSTCQQTMKLPQVSCFRILPYPEPTMLDMDVCRAFSSEHSLSSNTFHVVQHLIHLSPFSAAPRTKLKSNLIPIP